jgi:hypothetical protein
MARRPARRPTRERAAPREEAADLQGAWSLRRWWNGVTKTILTAGALATAVAAVLSLWPKPDPENGARFLSVHTTPGVPFDEFRQRLTSGHAQGVGMVPERVIARHVANQSDDLQAPADPTDVPGPGLSQGEPSAPPATSPAPDPEGTPRPATATPAPTLTASTSASQSRPSLNLANGVPADRIAQLTQDVCAGIQSKEPDIDVPCKPASPAESVFPGVALDRRGNLVDTDVAVERVARLFNETRTSRSTSGRIDPLGVVVTVDFELVGLRGRPIELSWSMWQTGGNARLYGEWLNTNLAYRVEPTSDRDTASLDIWIPLPKAPGSYYIRPILIADGATIASVATDPFS